MSWEDIMRRVLPPIGGVQPDITGPAGRFGAGEAEGRDPRHSSIPHGGVDFNYIGGRASRLNQSHPALRSPVDGVVENAGQGTVGRIAIRDKNGFLHEILHTEARHVGVGDPVAAGQIIGTMGNTGTRDQHVHYQLRDRAGKIINPTDFWDRQGAIDPNPSPPPYLNATSRAADIMFGGNANASPAAPAPDRPGDPFFNPFNPVPSAGFVPRPNAPAASDAPANFVDRFGNWDAKPLGGFGGISSPPPPVAPSPGKRSELSDDVTPTSAQATSAVWPYLAADSSEIGGVLGKAFGIGATSDQNSLPPWPLPTNPTPADVASSAADDVPIRRLVGRVVNLSAAPATPDAPPLSDDPQAPFDDRFGNWNTPPADSVPNAPNQPASPPALGIFSGKPMRNYPVRPPIWDFPDNSSTEGVDAFRRLWRRWLDAQ